MSEWGKWGSGEDTFPEMKKVVGKIPLPPPQPSWHPTTSSACPRSYLWADAGTVSTHPKQMKAEDRNDMARSSGPKWGLVTLQKFGQVDVGQGGTKERRGVQETANRVLKAVCLEGLSRCEDRDSGGFCALLEAPGPLLSFLFFKFSKYENTFTGDMANTEQSYI